MGRGGITFKHYETHHYDGARRQLNATLDLSPTVKLSVYVDKIYMK